MAVEAQLADGRILEFPDGTDPSVVQATIKKMLNQPTPEGGFKAAVKSGWENLQGDLASVAGKLGIMGTKEAEESIAAHKRKAEETFAPTQKGWTEEPWQKLKETLGGSLPYMAAPAVAGAAATLAGAPALVGMGAAGLASGAQFTGSNLSRQMDKDGGGKSLEEASLGAAAAAAVPQAALDVFALGKIPGVRQLIGAISKDVGTEAAKKIANQTFKEAATDYVKSTGKAMGAEGMTEAAQQVFERLQAGLSITDADARKEYWDNFLGGAVLGGAMAPAGRYVERGQERNAQTAADKAAADKAAADASAKAEADKATKVELADKNANAGPQLSDYQTPLTQPEGGPTRPTHLQPQRDMFGGEEANAPAAPEAVDPAERKAELTQQIRTLQDTLEEQRDAVAKAESPEDSLKAAKLFKNTEAALAQATQEHAGIVIPTSPEEKLAKAYAAWTKAKEAGDVDLTQKHAERIAELKAEGVQPPSESMTQKPIPMKSFTGSSESRSSFYPRVNADEINQPTATQALESGEDYKGDYTRNKEATAKDIADMAANRLDTSVTEQQRLFPATEGSKAPTNNELRRTWMTELRAAQKDGDRKRVDVAIENLRRLGSKPEKPLGEESKGAKAWEEAGVIGKPKGSAQPAEAHMLDVTRPPVKVRGDGSQEAITTAPDLRQQLRALPTQDTATEALLDRVHAKLDAVTASASARNAVGEWLHSLRTRNISPDKTRAVSDMMDRVERAAPPDQKDLFPEEKAAAQPKAEFKEDTQASRDEAANERRKAQQAALERTEATPTKLVSFEGQRYMRDFIADAPDAIRALEEQHRTAMDAGNEDAAASATTRINRIKAKQKLYTDQMSRTGEAAQRLRKRIAKVEGLIEKWKAALSTAETPKARAKARDALTKYEKQHEQMLNSMRGKRGIEITDVTRERPETEAPVAGERLEPRKIGPMVRKEVVAGEQRTGSAESIEGENKTSTKQKVEQSGKPAESSRPISKQDMREANKVSTEAAYAKLEERVRNAEQAADDADSDLDVPQAKRDLLRKRADTLREELRTLKGEAPVAPKVEAAGKTKAPKAPKSRTRSVVEDIEPDWNDNDNYLLRSNDSKSVGMDKSAVEAAVASTTAGWKNMPEIRVVNSVSELPLKARGRVVKAQEENGKAVPGLYDENTKRVYLIADNVRDANDARLTVVHEVAGHFGLRKIMGDTYTDTMNRLYNGNADVRKEADRQMANDSALTRETAVEEVLAYMAEKAPESSAVKRLYFAIKSALAKMFGINKVSDKEVAQIVANARSYVEGNHPEGPNGGKKDSDMLLRSTPSEGRLIKQKSDTRSVFTRATGGIGMWLERGIVDMHAPLIRALHASGADKHDVMQAEYSVRKADQSISMIREFMMHGAPILQKDKKDFRGLVAGKGPSVIDALKAFNDIPDSFAKQMNTTKVEMGTDYMAAKLAKRIGASRLGLTDADIDAFIAKVDANPAAKKAMEKFRSVFNQYNEQLINTVRDTGAITSEQAAAYLKNKDYIPLYRVRGGQVEMMLADNQYVSMGDIANTPFIHSLKGGDDQILPLGESLLYNTKLMTEVAMTNLAKRNVGYVMAAAGKPADKMFVRKVKKGGIVPKGADVLTWNEEPKGDDDSGKRYLHIDTEGTPMAGIPSYVLSESIEGFHATMPAFVKATAALNDVLRAGITRTPIYVVRQLLRDPMSASSTVGLKDGPFTAVASAMKEYASSFGGKNQTIEEMNRRGLVQSNILTGDMDDISKLLTQIGENGNPGVYRKLMNALDTAAHNADAATRAQIWKDSKERGLSDFEAELRVMESMNFHKRGGWASIQYMSRMVPFFNSGIQALNVAAKALQGKMPFEKELQVRQKFINNAMMLALAGLSYAAFMDENDDEYGKLKPSDRYGNLHISLGEGATLRLPIGYAETGGLAWAIGQAVYDQWKGGTNTEQDIKALGKYAISALPGQGAVPLPTGLKQYVEWTTNTDMRTFQDIVPARLQHSTADQQFTNDTPRAYRALGELGISPIKFQHLMDSLLSNTGTSIARLVDKVTADDKVEAPALTPDQYPFLSGIMQNRKSSEDKELMYSVAEEAKTAQTTFNRMRSDGAPSEELRAYRDKHSAEIMLAPMAGKFTEIMGELNSRIRVIQRQAIPAEQKTQRILEIEKRQKELSERYAAAMKQATERLARASQ